MKDYSKRAKTVKLSQFEIAIPENQELRARAKAELIYYAHSQGYTYVTARDIHEGRETFMIRGEREIAWVEYSPLDRETMLQNIDGLVEGYSLNSEAETARVDSKYENLPDYKDLDFWERLNK